MRDNLLYLISAKIEDIANELARRNSIEGSFVEARLEGDLLSIFLKPLDRIGSKASPGTGASANQANSAVVRASPSVRAAGKKRNRMRTRGWNVVGQITNKYGMRSNVYYPFVVALIDANVSRAEQRSIVAKILRSNGNNPSTESIKYFLDNTLEFLAQGGTTGT